MDKTYLQEAYHSYCKLIASYHQAKPTEKVILSKSIEEMREFLMRHVEELCIAS